MRKFLPIPNVCLTDANCQQQAEKIVTFLNTHAQELGTTFHQKECRVYADRIKASRIDYILGVIAGYLLSK